MYYDIFFQVRELDQKGPDDFSLGTTCKPVDDDSGAPRAKRACRAPWVNKSTHPRKFGNHVTDRPTVRPHHRFTNVYSHTFQLLWEPRRKLIAHQCCRQLTAVKTKYPLTSITWPYRGLRCLDKGYFDRIYRTFLLWLCQIKNKIVTTILLVVLE